MSFSVSNVSNNVDMTSISPSSAAALASNKNETLSNENNDNLVASSLKSAATVASKAASTTVTAASNAVSVASNAATSATTAISTAASSAASTASNATSTAVNAASKATASATSAITSTASSASNLMTSAFASVSEVANKSIFSSISSSSPNTSPRASTSNYNSLDKLENNTNGERSSSLSSSNNNNSHASPAEKRKPFVFLRALSLSTTKQSSNIDLDPSKSLPSSSSSSSTSILSESLSNKANSLLNKINPFESSANNNNNNNKSQQFKKERTKSLLHRLESSVQKNIIFTTVLDAEEDTDVFEPSSKPSLTDENNNYDKNSTEMLSQSQSNHNISSDHDLSGSGNRGDSTSSFSSNSSLKKKTKPVGSIEYLVENGDTIEKIALKWNTVPSEIKRLNRLSTRVIFPGQIFYVPDPDYVPPPVPMSPPLSPHSKSQLPVKIINELNHLENIDSSINDSITTNNTSSNSTGGGFNIFKWKSNSTPKPGHVEKKDKKLSTSLSVSSEDNGFRQKGPLTRRHTITEEEAKQLDEECMQRFIKVNCKIVTRSKGCFEGVLIITPSAVMFDPSFPVNEQTTDVENNLHNNNHTNQNTNKTCGSIYDEASAIIPIEVISNVIMYEDLSLKDVQEYFDYQYQLDLIDQDNANNESESSASKGEILFDLNESSCSNKEESTKDATADSNSKNLTESDQIQNSKHDTILFIDDSNTSTLNTSNNTTNNNNNTNNNDESQIKKPLADTSLSNANDSELSKNNPHNLSTTSTTSSANSTTCYICIKVNKNKDFITCPLDRKMKNRLISEFWFQINDNSTDKICAFFLEWKSDPTYALTPDSVPTGRFQLIKPDEKLADLIAENLMADSFCKKLNMSFSSTNRLINKDNNFVKDWEIVNLQELESKIKKEIEIEKEYKTLPTLMNKSTILKEEHLRKLNVNLIPRAIGYNWILSFSTDENGFSLGTLYRNLAEIEGPCLVVVQDTNKHIFGAMASTKLYPSEHFYGTGESFLYTFYPSFKIFKWTGENTYFTRGTQEGLGFGCGEGYHGLWFDNDLLYGHTQKSKTYDSEMLTSLEYFTIAAIEVWTFSDGD